MIAAPAAQNLTDRFLVALDQVQAKLLALAASAPLLLLALLIVMGAVWLGGVLSRHLHFLTRLSDRNPYIDGLLRRIVRSIFVLAGVLVALDLLGATPLIGALLGSAGLVGLVLGFAFKDIVENYVAGVLLGMRQPFSPGDTVCIDAHEGKVVSLNSRATVLMTIDGNHLMLPNGLVFKSVLLNFTRNPKRRFDFELTLNPCAPLHDAMDAGIAVLATMDGVLEDPAPASLILDIPGGGARLQFTGWIDQRNNDVKRTRSEALRLVAKSLDSQGYAAGEPIQRIRLERGEAMTQRANEGNGAGRDTSVDHALDEQIGDARRGESAGDLLEQPTASGEASR
ncbi:MAG: mechanosensitive ion channel family protein [Pseudomonadota bacterium]|nr:mechanosensitive ion channel family protein [Pseudomonadota bacterium]MDQ3160129.1 mechanosensitive ion channel family protein [Pseudomonadota bacterium]